MAISQPKPLLLLVLVSLFFFPTLGVFFQTCDPPHLYPIQISAVDISPDPVNDDRIVNFKIVGNTNKVISDDGATVRLEIRSIIDRSLRPHLAHYSLSNVTTCPVARGPFALTFSTVVPSDIFKINRYAAATVSIEKPDLANQMICLKFLVKLHDYYISQVTG